MDEEILTRLERIERRLDAIEGRFARSFGPPPRPTAPPPKPPTPEAPDLEAELGGRWLPRAGAGAVIGAIAYLVGLGLQRELISPTMVASGIAATCGLVALAGARLRGARETFGNVLVGLAAGGLYVDAVGAYLDHGLLGGEATVAACVAISVATLAFGARRGLPSMLAVGLSGGLLAALMPLSKGAVAASTGLILLVAAPPFAVSAARRWPQAAIGVWAAAFAASTVVAFQDAPPALRLLPLDAVSLMALAAWAWGAEAFPASDPRGAFPFVVAVLTGGVALGVWNGPGGVLHVGGFGLVVGLLGRAFGGRKPGQRIVAGGLTAAFVVAPLGAHGFYVPLLLASLAAIEAVAFRRRFASMIALQAPLAATAYVLLLLADGVEGRPALSGSGESGLILLLTAAFLAAAAVLDRPEARFATGLALWGLATRAAVVDLGLPASEAITVAWIVSLAGLLTWGFVRRRPELRRLGLFVAAATAAKVMLVDLADLDAAAKAVVLLAFGIVLLAGGYAYVRATGRADEGAAPEP